MGFSFASDFLRSKTTWSCISGAIAIIYGGIQAAVHAYQLGLPPKAIGAFTVAGVAGIMGQAFRRDSQAKSAENIVRSNEVVAATVAGHLGPLGELLQNVSSVQQPFGQSGWQQPGSDLFGGVMPGMPQGEFVPGGEPEPFG